jgi:hypothetical protein
MRSCRVVRVLKLSLERSQVGMSDAVDEILVDLGATSATEVLIDLVVGYKPTGPPLYEAVFGGKRKLLNDQQAVALRTRGAQTKIPALLKIPVP